MSAEGQNTDVSGMKPFLESELSYILHCNIFGNVLFFAFNCICIFQALIKKGFGIFFLQFHMCACVRESAWEFYFGFAYRSLIASNYFFRGYFLGFFLCNNLFP